MTSDPRDQKPEIKFEQDLEAVRSAWSGLEKTEPPDLLDQAVLNTARRELEGRSKRLPLRWLGGFATAAVVVLALSIVLQQDQQAPVPAMEESENLKLDQAVSAPVKKKTDRDLAEEKAGREQSARQDSAENDDRLEKRLNQSSPAPPPESSAMQPRQAAALGAQKEEFEEKPAAPAPQAGTAASPVAEMIADEMPAETAKVTDSALEAEAWIEKLLLLQDTQQDERLVEELAAFREAFPDYPLPPELEY